MTGILIDAHYCCSQKQLGKLDEKKTYSCCERSSAETPPVIPLFCFSFSFCIFQTNPERRFRKFCSLSSHCEKPPQPTHQHQQTINAIPLPIFPNPKRRKASSIARGATSCRLKTASTRRTSSPAMVMSARSASQLSFIQIAFQTTII